MAKRNLFRGVCPHCGGLIEIEIDENGEATLTQIWRKENAIEKENQSGANNRNNPTGGRIRGTDDAGDAGIDAIDNFWENF